MKKGNVRPMKEKIAFRRCIRAFFILENLTLILALKAARPAIANVVTRNEQILINVE